jgi:hypothetical protein
MLRMSGTIPLLPLYGLKAWAGTTLPLPYLNQSVTVFNGLFPNAIEEVYR